MILIQAVFSTTYYKMYLATSIPNLTSRSCGNSLTSVCSPGKSEPVTGHWRAPTDVRQDHE